MTRIRSKARRRVRVAGAAVILLSGGLVSFGLASRPVERERFAGPGVEPLLVASARVVWQKGYSVKRSFVGRVEARQESELGFEVPGMVSSISVEEGQRVSAGEVLATLDRARLEARRSELVAARDAARAAEELAAATLRRTTQAQVRNAVSTQMWDEADKALRTASAKLNRTEAAVHAIDVDLEKTVLRSPFDAVVARRRVDRGRVVDAGTPIVRVLERVRPEVRVGVGGEAVDALSNGQELDVAIRGTVSQGVVTAVLPTRDRAGRGVDVVVALGEELGVVRSGDLARVGIERHVNERGFWVPLQGLTEGTRGLWAVYVIAPDESGLSDLGVLQRAELEVLHQESDRVYARGPLAEGARFAAGGMHRITAGMTVRFKGAEQEPQIVAYGGDR